MSETTDDQLMQQYREGDVLAFQELYRRYKSELYRYVFWRTPQPQWVDEIVQDTWANLLRARNRYHPNAAFRIYLYLLARNRLFEMLGQHQHLLPVAGSGKEKNKEQDKANTGRDLAFVLADAMRQKTPRAYVDRSPQANPWIEHLNGLPSELGEVVILQKFIGMSLIDIAEIVSIPVGQVRARLRDAVFILKWLVPGAPARKPLKPGEKEVNDVDDNALEAFLRGTDAITLHLRGIEQVEPTPQIEAQILKRVNFALDQDSYLPIPPVPIESPTTSQPNERIWWAAGTLVVLLVVGTIAYVGLQPGADTPQTAVTGGTAIKESTPRTTPVRETEMVAHTSKLAPVDNAALGPKEQARIVTGQAVEAQAAARSSVPQSGGSASPEKWLEVINNLLKAGLTYQAVEEFAKFRAVNPDYPVPAAMLEQLKKAKK